MQAVSLAKQSSAGMIVALSKSDLPQNSEVLRQARQMAGGEPFCISAKTGQGITALLDEIYRQAVGSVQLSEGVLITNARHAHALRRAGDALTEAISAMERGEDLDCITIDLNDAWMRLGEITGQTVGEEIIDRIFNKFCLGK